MNMKKFILVLLVVMILALTIASTASAKKADPCDKAWAKFFKVAEALSHSKTTSPKAQAAHFKILNNLYADVLAACP